MNDTHHDWILVAACSVVAAGIAYLATCGTARAVEAEVRYQNAATVTLTRLRVIQGGTVTEYPVSCAPGATCTLRADLRHGLADTKLEGQAAGTLWSLPSNVVPYRAVDPKLCLADPVCRGDYDADGVSTVADFRVFLGSLGKKWPAPPAP